jgi:hypothetical protein
MQRLLVITSNNVQLPDNEGPCPATIEIQCDSGEISRVTLGKTDGQEYRDRDTVEFWDLGDLVVLPGLVEYVPGDYFVLLSLSCDKCQCTCTLE